MSTPKSLSRDQVHEIDRRAAEEFGLPGLVLMENAGRSCFLSLMSHGCRGPVVICCGKGNNGGDGFVIARHLDGAGMAVKILVFAEPSALRGDAATNFRIAQKCQLPLHVMDPTVSAAPIDAHLAGADWIVDALLGTGARGNPQPPISTAIERINASSAKKFAVDLPSGLDCDTGEAAVPTVRADVTCTFVAAKIGFANPAARACLGTLEIADIGLPRGLLPT